jgi:hypothetical protein
MARDSERFQTAEGTDVELDFENETLLVDGVEQEGDFTVQSNMVLEQLMDDKLESVEQ